MIIRGKDRPIVTLKGAQIRSQVVQSGALVVDRLNPLLPLTAKQIKLKSAEKIEGLWYVSFWQIAGGFIVYGSSLGFSVDRRGQILSTGSVIYPGIEVPAAVKVDRKQALETAIRSIKDFHKLGYKLLAENVIMYPDRKANPLRYYQVYAFNFFTPPEVLHPASPGAGGVFLWIPRPGISWIARLFLNPWAVVCRRKALPLTPKNCINPKSGNRNH